MDMSQERFCVEINQKMPHTLSGARLLHGNLQEKTHMDISQERFCLEINQKRAHTFSGARVNTSIEHRASVTYRKNPFSVATLFGE